VEEESTSPYRLVLIEADIVARKEELDGEVFTVRSLLPSSLPDRTDYYIGLVETD
jgi:hypothetical protein